MINLPVDTHDIRFHTIALSPLVIPLMPFISVCKVITSNLFQTGLPILIDAHKTYGGY